MTTENELATITTDPEHKRRHKRGWKRRAAFGGLRTLGYLCAFLLLLLWVGISLFDANRAKDYLAAALSQRTGFSVSITKLNFNPLHPYTLLAEGVRIDKALSVDKLYLEIAQIDWLNQHIYLQNIDLINPTLTLPLPKGLPRPPNFSLSLTEGKITNLNLRAPKIQISGLNATFSEWQQPRPTEVAQTKLNLSAQRIERGELRLQKVALNGIMNGSSLKEAHLQTSLFDGGLSSDLELDWARRSLRLNNLFANGLRIELSNLEQNLPLDELQIQSGKLEKSSFNHLQSGWALNDFNGELHDIQWQRQRGLQGEVSGEAGELAQGTLQLERLKGTVQLGKNEHHLTLDGQGFEGSFKLDTTIGAQLWQIHQLSLHDMDISLPVGWWSAWQKYAPKRIDIERSDIERLKVLSFDDAMPLVLQRWQLLIRDLRFDEGVWRENLGLGLIESSWGELVWRGLLSRNGSLSVDVTPQRWRLSRLESDFNDGGELRLNGELSRTMDEQLNLEIYTKHLDLNAWSELFQVQSPLAGAISLQGFVGASRIDWRSTLEGELSGQVEQPLWLAGDLNSAFDAWLQQPPAAQIWNSWQGVLPKGETPLQGIEFQLKASSGLVELSRLQTPLVGFSLLGSGSLYLPKEDLDLKLIMANERDCREFEGLWRGTLQNLQFSWLPSAVTTAICTKVDEQ